MTMRSAAAAALLLVACAPNAQPRRAPMVLASAPARVAPPPVIRGRPMAGWTGGRICLEYCPGEHPAAIEPVLFIVDGQVVTPGPVLTLPGIDPARIANIEIIRAPLAVELYGPGASAGAVLITMKHDR